VTVLYIQADVDR